LILDQGITNLETKKKKEEEEDDETKKGSATTSQPMFIRLKRRFLYISS